MLSYYVQLREPMCSSINCSARPEPEAYSQPERRHLVGGVRPPEHLTDSTVSDTAAQKDFMPAELVDLDDAFEAMTEEMKFDWPEFSPVDRIKAGLIQSTLGLLLFLVFIVATGFLHQNLMPKP